jgi:hydroxymethylpyrimidine/phosphomethylpyrimidine kinase
MVIDPVLRSTSGVRLFRGRAAPDYAPLFDLASVVTPNLPEAEEILGREIGGGRGEREQAAKDLQTLTGCAIVLKGGHAKGAADDLVFDGSIRTWLAGKRIAASRRGTGCRFASALAARLAMGDDLVQAAREAKALVRRYLSERLHPSLPRKRGEVE